MTDTQEDFLDECLNSLRGQTHTALQILLVPFGESSRVVPAARRHEVEDWRVKLLDGGVPDLGTAWDTGAAEASGEFLAFVWGADRVPARALEQLLSRLESTGSDFAVGRRGDAGRSGRSERRLQARVHQRDRLAVSIRDFPTALLDVGVENRLIRTAFWRRAGLRFAGAGGAVLTIPVVESYLLASRFDVLAEVTYQDLDRGRGVPFGHLPNAMEDLPEWVTTQARIQRTLQDTGSAVLLEAWLFGVLNQGAQPFLDDCERATPQEWEMLVRSVESLTKRVPDSLWQRIRAESKVKLWLAAHNRRTELEEFVAARWFADGDVPTEVRDGRVHAHLPFWDDKSLGIPEECFVMTAEETGLSCSLRRARWTDRDVLELEIYAFANFVGMDGAVPQVAVSLVRKGDGLTVPLEVRQQSDTDVNRFAGHRHQSYESGKLVAEVDAARLREAFDAARAAGSGSDAWQVQVDLTVHGIRRGGPVTHVEVQGSAAMVPPRLAGLARVSLEVSSGPVTVRVSRVPLALTSFEVDGRVVRGRTTPPPGEGPWRLVAEHPDGPRVACSLASVGDGAAFEMEIPELPAANVAGQRQTWRVHAVSRLADEPLAWPEETWPAWAGDSDGGTLAWHRTDDGTCELREARNVPIIESVSVAGAEVVLTGRWLGQAPTGACFSLRDHRQAVEGRVEPTGDGFVARLPLRSSSWQLPVLPLPAGPYRLQLEWRDGDGATQADSILIGDRLCEDLPVEELTETHLVRVFRNANGRLAFRLTAPWADDERGPYAQQQLQDELSTWTAPVDPSVVYLQSYAGHTATDSQLAIHQELRRRDAGLSLYWGVSDYSSAVPEGGTPVLIKSRRWYEVLATAGYLVNNIDFERWFQKRPGQRFLQTFHGYPAKAMGIGLWTAKQFTPRRIAMELERTSGDWDLILTPDPSMDRYYRSEYRYEGAIHNKGYPRDDALVSSDSARTRAATRARLGIRDEQTAVLYAPTWRDHLATNYRSARLVKHLDLETASGALGDDFVLLMRGHRFHARAPQRAQESARVLDVTDYPEINDLILAADVAVLDYSSLRFDFALTGKPMLFLVPDLHLYTGGVRGFLYDYRESAPGPLLDTADDVVEALSNLEAVQEQYATALKRFNERFQRWHDGHAARRVVDAFFDVPPAADPE